MWAYLVRRLLLAILAISGVLVIAFFLSHVIPGDPVGAILGPQAPEPLIEELRRRWGFDRPIPEQFVVYLQRLARGDLGTSLATHRAVTSRPAGVLPGDHRAGDGLDSGWRPRRARHRHQSPGEASSITPPGSSR